MAAESQAGNVAIAHRRVDQDGPLGDVEGPDGAQSKGGTAGIVEPDQRALEAIRTIARHRTGVVDHDAQRESGERETPRGCASKVRIDGGLAVLPALDGGSPAHVLADGKA